MGDLAYNQQSTWIPNYKGKAKDPKGKGKKGKAKHNLAAEAGKGDPVHY